MMGTREEIGPGVRALYDMAAYGQQRTGWPPGLLQDDSPGLSRWLASRPDARRRVREALSLLDRQDALDRMADNARELGLDYEPKEQA